MWDNISNKKLYVLVLAGVGFLVLTALGGGFFNQQGLWFEHWQHKAFRGLCHQDPQRAFWLAGTPMAVCSRCFGIYAGFLAAWLFAPAAIKRLQYFEQYKGKLLAGAVAINVMDFLGNLIGIWQNTLFTRFGLGLLIGITASIAIGYVLIEKTQSNLKGIQYGTNASG